MNLQLTCTEWVHPQALQRNKWGTVNNIPASHFCQILAERDQHFKQENHLNRGMIILRSHYIFCHSNFGNVRLHSWENLHLETKKQELLQMFSSQTGAISSNTKSHWLQLHREFSRAAVDLDISHPWLLDTRQTYLELFMLILTPKSGSQQLYSDTTGGTRASANLWVQ